MYSDEELEEIDKRIKEASKKEDQRIAKFWKDEYPKLSIDEKAKYWAGGLFQSMRMQEESRQNPYAIYSENWLRDALNTDADFVELLPKIFRIWGGMFDADKVDTIVQRLLKRINDSKK
jgi:hypothetical protein